MRQMLRSFVLNEKIILAVIFINSVVIYLQTSGINNTFLIVADLFCTFIFILEMLVKQLDSGFRAYWKDGWNKLDGTLVILTLPSLVLNFFPEVPIVDFSIFIVLRLLRVFRFFRLMHFFPNFSQLVSGFKLALRESSAVLLCFFVIIIIFGLINCALFKEFVPEYFNTPLKSIYSMFRFCTVEGWYEIPDAIALRSSSFWADVVRVYFCLQLLMGGILGMSFINSVFVDAMAADNNDDVKAQLKEMERKIDRLLDVNEMLRGGKDDQTDGNRSNRRC